MRFLDAAAIRAAAPMPDLLDAVEAAYRQVATGGDRSPLRTRMTLDNGDLLLMPGIRSGGAGTTVKLVTVIPDNPGRGLPTIHAVVIWIDATTGEPLAVLDGATLTAMRTGAASGVGARLMARTDASVLAVIGAGAQAPWQVRAVLAARPIREVRVFARDADRRERFVAEMVAELGPGIAVVAARSAEEAVRDAQVICCATTSLTPVIDADWVAAGAHVNGVGSFRRGMVEIPPELFGRASTVAVDQRSAALEEAGDLLAALDAGLLAEGGYLEIGSLPADWADRRPPEAITIFKSVGLAIQDLAAAELVIRPRD